MAADVLRRYAVAGVALCALTLAAASCAADGEPETAPSADATASHAPTSSSADPVTEPSPTADPDRWRSKFTAAEVDAYDDALRRWDSYESRSEPIWSKGEATPAAQQLFKEFFPHPAWAEYWERLAGYEQVGVQVSGTPTVYWSKAQSVSANRSSVQIQQCVDYTSVRRTQDGINIARPSPEPQLRTIFLTRPDGYDWLIFGVRELVGGKPRPCEP